MQERTKLSDIAHDKIKERILNNKFAPGEHLDEVSLCEMLNISRTPLREAINRLVDERLLVTVPQKGIFVPEMSIQTISELFTARKLIEPTVIMLSVKHMDRNVLMEFRRKTIELLENENIQAIHNLDYEFHSYINSNCRNQYMLQSVTFISEQFQRVRTQNFYPMERSYKGAKEHIDIIDTLIRGEYDKLPELMLNHITTTETYYYKQLLNNDIPHSNIEHIKKHFHTIS